MGLQVTKNNKYSYIHSKGRVTDVEIYEANNLYRIQFKLC